MFKNYHLILLKINGACFGKRMDESSFVTLLPLEVNVIFEATVAVILHSVRNIFLNDCILVLIASKSNF